MKAGFKDVSVYQEGFPEWEKSGYPVESLEWVAKVEIPSMSASALKERLDSGEAVAVDLRDTEDRGVGSIAGSLRIPLEDLTTRYEEIPKGKSAVLVDLRGKQTKIAGQYLVAKGYRNVFQLAGGVQDGWIKEGLPIER